MRVTWGVYVVRTLAPPIRVDMDSMLPALFFSGAGEASCATPLAPNSAILCMMAEPALLLSPEGDGVGRSSSFCFFLSPNKAATEVSPDDVEGFDFFKSDEGLSA